MDLYSKYDKLIRRLVERAGLPASIDPDDVVQSIWLEIYRGPFDDTRHGAKSYIGKIVKSKIADARRDNPLNERLGEIVVEPADPPLEAKEEVEAVLSKLSKSDRSLLTQRYLKGISKRRLAKRRGVSRQRIDAKIETAVRKARSLREKPC